MEKPSVQVKRARKNARSRYNRRSNRILEQSDEIGRLFSCKVYLLIRGPDRGAIIYSNCEANWPPLSSSPEPTEFHSCSDMLHKTPLGKTDLGHPVSKFQRKKSRILSSADDFCRNFGVRVYLAVQCQTGYTIVYNSSSSRYWPPSVRQLVSE
ncbi:uncharacterized protein LDX57_008657 [Aspergillus melleus]|uniref:uncharacterized protein n=1 Tax=Aspergillus melleus TaxID=138277 RepID=UPI001E8EA252|nr:uncharacterized protein LDX57_008657 [Aspergillus melleus]KAH8430996.1 hypothetical protein LDX57_008657 [Aspergillus melleus]